VQGRIVWVLCSDALRVLLGELQMVVVNPPRPPRLPEFLESGVAFTAQERAGIGRVIAHERHHWTHHVRPCVFCGSRLCVLVTCITFPMHQVRSQHTCVSSEAGGSRLQCPTEAS
jgi:hypothetical protein